MSSERIQYSGTDFTHSPIKEQALQVLAFLQKRDKLVMDKQVDMAREDAVRDLSFGRLALSIPEDHFPVAVIAFPDLRSDHADMKTAAYKQFMLHPISYPYRVNKNLQRM